MRTIIIILSLGFSALFLSCQSDRHAHAHSSGKYNNRADAASAAIAPRASISPQAPYPEASFQTPQKSEVYVGLQENKFIGTDKQAVSTFSIDADGASFSNVRRFIQQDNKLPPKGAVRAEEMINYFDLDYQYTDTNHPINVNGEISQCPWNPSNKIVRIGVKGKSIDKSELPPSNFVFLIDVSGSMGSEDKLELLKRGFMYFVDNMSEEDRVAIVTYAGAAGLVLESTSGKYKKEIKDAINRLGSGGSTAGAAGILTAYEIAERNYIASGNNRIILGTDGDFNVGIRDRGELIALVEEKRENGVYLTVLGVGRGNLNDAALEQIANKGNGTYEYIDHIEQLKKVFVYDYGKFFTVAKDVKIQIEFNPQKVAQYRLIGYENRTLNNRDFVDDKKDAGEIGANQDITALYEIIPNEENVDGSEADLTVNLRYKKEPNGKSIPFSLKVFDENKSFAQSSNQMKLVSSAASFAMLLGDSEYKGDANYGKILSWLDDSKLSDRYGFKAEFAGLVRIASRL